MDYLFLKQKKIIAGSAQQKNLFFKAAEQQWKQHFAEKGESGRKVDCDIYKYILYNLEVKQIFLDPQLSLKKLCVVIGTNQTYLSNAINRYFGCNLKKLLNTYRVEYAKDLLRAGKCSRRDIYRKCGFSSRSVYYTAFGQIVGMSPLHYLLYECNSQVAGLTDDLNR